MTNGIQTNHTIKEITEEIPGNLNVTNPYLTVTNPKKANGIQTNHTTKKIYLEKLNSNTKVKLVTAMEEGKRKREDTLKEQVWQEAHSWMEDKGVKRISTGARKEIRMRLESKGIKVTEEEIRKVIQKEKNKAKQRRYTGILKESKRELEAIAMARDQKKEELAILKERFQTEKKALKEEINHYQMQLRKANEEKAQAEEGKERVETERDHYKNSESRAMVKIEELKERLGREVYKLGKRYLIESIEQYVVKFQIPKYESTFDKLLSEVFTMEATWDWRTAIPKEEKEELFVSVRIADGRKEMTKNPEAYGNSNRELLRFVRNVIAHRADHKFKTLDEVYEKINSWLPGLFQSWGTTEATILGINSTTRNGFASDVLVDLKKQWGELKEKRDELRIKASLLEYSMNLYFSITDQTINRKTTSNMQSSTDCNDKFTERRLTANKERRNMQDNSTDLQPHARSIKTKKKDTKKRRKGYTRYQRFQHKTVNTEIITTIISRAIIKMGIIISVNVTSILLAVAYITLKPTIYILIKMLTVTTKIVVNLSITCTRILIEKAIAGAAHRFCSSILITLMIFAMVVDTATTPEQSLEENKIINIAAWNIKCNSRELPEVEKEVLKRRWDIVFISETGLTSSKIGPPQTENQVYLNDYVTAWNNPTTTQILRRWKKIKTKKIINEYNKQIKNIKNKPNSKKVIRKLEKEREEKITFIKNQKKVKKARGGVGFLIHKNVVGICRPKVLKKFKRKGKEAINNTRGMILKIKEEEKTTKILGVYLPSEGISRNNSFYQKHITPLVKKWEKKNQNVIILGDMNTIISEDDHWTTKNLKKRKSPKHAMLKDLLNREENSWGDAFKELNGNSKKYTYNKYETVKNKIDPLLTEDHYTATRIDHIITSPGTTNRITKCEIISNHQIRTDHNPITCSLQTKIDSLSAEYQQINEEAYTRKYQDKQLSGEEENNLKANMAKEWKAIEHNIQEWTDLTAPQNYGLIEQAIHNAARESLTPIQREKKQPAIAESKKLGQITKARRTAIKQKNRILNALLNNTSLNISFKTIPTTNSYYQSIPNYPQIREETPYEEGQQAALYWLTKTEKAIKTLTKEANEIKRNFKHKNINKAIKKINKSYRRGERNFWAKISNKTKGEDQITAVELPNKRTTNRFDKVMEGFTHFWKNLYGGKTEKLSLTEYKWYNRKDIESIKSEETEPFTIKEVTDMIKQMANTSPGTDGCSAKMLKSLPLDTVKALCNLYNYCLMGGTIPGKWKEGQITLIYKKGPSWKPGNYRPITLLQNVYKIYSNLITARLTKYSEKYIIHRTQSGFRQSKSTTDNCITVKAIYNDAKKKGKELHAMYVDISKAFDSVQHWHIEEVLRYYKVDIILITAIMNLLKNRKARLKINSQVTEWFEVTQGTPQGDPISPLLFLICINPIIEYINQKDKGYKLSKWLKISILAYADDIILLGNNRNEINKITKWLTSWMDAYGLKVNHSKSGYTHNSPSKNQGIATQGHDIPTINKNESYLYLGININLDLNWEKHESTTKAKFLWRLKIIKSKRLTVPQTVDIINIVANAYVIYAMDVCDFSPNFIRKLDSKVAKLVRMKMGISSKSGNALLYAPIKRGGLGLIKLADKLVAIKISGKCRQLRGNSIAELTLRSMLYEGKRTDSNEESWKESLKKEGLKIHKKYNKTYSLLRLIGKHLDKKEKQEYRKSGLKYITDIISGNKLIEYCKLTTKTIKKLEPQLWGKIKKAICIKKTNLIKPKYRTGVGNETTINHTYNKKDQILYGEYTLIWTDGSVRIHNGERIAIGAIFLNKNSVRNSTFLIEGRIKTSYIAECVAIEEALVNAPANENIRIITDSKSFTTAYKAYRNKRWKLKKPSEATDIIKRIKSLIRKREEEYGTHVKFTHIFSHIEKKEREAYRKGNKQYKLFKNKISNKKAKLGKLWELAVWGNVKADKATNSDPSELEIKEENLEDKRKTGKIIIQNQKGEAITSSLTHYIKKKKEKEYSREIRNLPKRGAHLRDKDTCQSTSNMYMKDKTWKRININKLVWKARTRNLPTRDQKVHQYRALINNQWTPIQIKSKPKTIEHAIRRESEKEIYNNNVCPACECKEDVDHIYSGECQRYHEQQALTADKVRDYIKKEKIMPPAEVDRLPLWIPDPYPPYPPTQVAREAWDELSRYQKSYGAMGMCPKALRKVIGGEHSGKHIKKILEIIREGTYQIWKTRSKEHAQKYEIKKHRAKARIKLKM